MKHLRRSAFIVGAHVLGLNLPTAVFAQDDGNPIPLPEGNGTTEDPSLALPTPSDEVAPPPPAPPEERPYDAPLGEDPPPEVTNDSSVTPPSENGPAVDDTYNSTDARDDSAWSLFRVGPTIQLGFPHPLSYGLEGMFAQVLSFGFSTGSYNVTQIDHANIKIKSWDVFARWHPFAGSFFLGGAYGHQTIDGRFDDDAALTLNGFPTEVPIRVDAAIRSHYVSPRIGWMAVYPTGLTFGFEIGAQIPLSPDTKVEATVPGASPSEEALVTSTDDYKDLKKQADEAVKILGKKTIPYLSLLKVGWLF